jgi:integrase
LTTSAEQRRLGVEHGHRILVVTRKGGKIVTIPLAPRTARRSTYLSVSRARDRSSGPPMAVGWTGTAPGGSSAGVARRAGITKPAGPHTLRHAFITAALDAGVSLRDVQEAASHTDPAPP